jgi:hypothetical protein
MSDDRFDDFLQGLARELDPPPAPPREAMWERIAAERARVRERRTKRRFQFPTWVVWVPALAATLALGIGLGRWSSARAPSLPAPVASVNADPAEAAPLDVFTLATLRHLSSAEALLAAFPADARAGRTTDVARWAGDLLTDTRLLADTPAGDDPELRRLLGDLELLLAQIAALGNAPRGGDVRLIQDGMNQNDVLDRLRAATSDGVANGL